MVPLGLSLFLLTTGANLVAGVCGLVLLEVPYLWDLRGCSREQFGGIVLQVHVERASLRLA